MKTSKKNSIRTIWFDLGNVILPFDFMPAFKKLSLYGASSISEIKEYFLKRAHLEADCDEGRVHSYKLYHLLKKHFNLSGLSYQKFQHIWNDIFKENKSVSKLIGRLRKNGYRLLLTSNTNKLHFDHIHKTYPVLEHFHSYILSYKLKVRKPKRGFYNAAIKASRAMPSEIFYTDDRIDLIKAAAMNHKVNAHQFVSFSQLRRAMESVGIQTS